MPKKLKELKELKKLKKYSYEFWLNQLTLMEKRQHFIGGGEIHEENFTQNQYRFNIAKKEAKAVLAGFYRDAIMKSRNSDKHLEDNEGIYDDDDWEDDPMANMHNTEQEKMKARYNNFLRMTKFIDILEYLPQIMGFIPDRGNRKVFICPCSVAYQNDPIY